MGAELKSAKGRFVESWGQMGGAWGINKTMARMHALLMIADKPLTMDDVMAELAVSRGNASMNLRALVDWGLIRRVSLPRDRKEYFASEKDVWTMCCRIARERQGGRRLPQKARRAARAGPPARLRARKGRKPGKSRRSA